MGVHESHFFSSMDFINTSTIKKNGEHVPILTGPRLIVRHKGNPGAKKILRTIRPIAPCTTEGIDYTRLPRTSMMRRVVYPIKIVNRAAPSNLLIRPAPRKPYPKRNSKRVKPDMTSISLERISGGTDIG